MFEDRAAVAGGLAKANRPGDELYEVLIPRAIRRGWGPRQGESPGG